MSGWFESREASAGKGGDLYATIILIALGAAVVLYALYRVIGAEGYGGLAAGLLGGALLGALAARREEPSAHWAGTAALAALCVLGAYAAANAGAAPDSHALALWLSAGAALLTAGPAILAGRRFQLGVWRAEKRRHDRRELRERMDAEARRWRQRR